MLSVVPAVLRVDIYAIAALSGSSATMIAGRLGCPPLFGAMWGGAICFGFRVIAFRQGWSLPHLWSASQVELNSAAASREEAPRRLRGPGDGALGALA